MIAVIAAAMLVACTSDDEASAARRASLGNWARDYCRVIDNWASESGSLDIVTGESGQFETEQRRIGTRWPAFAETSDRAARELESMAPPAGVEAFHAATVQLIRDLADGVDDSFVVLMSATDEEMFRAAALEFHNQRVRNGRGRDLTFDEFGLDEDVRATLDATPGCGYSTDSTTG